MVFLLHHLTRFLFDGRNEVYAFTDSINIHHGTTCKDDGFMFLE